MTAGPAAAGRAASPDRERLVEAVARATSAHLQSDPALFDAARRDVGVVFVTALPLLAELIEAERTCSECAEWYQGKPTHKHDLVLGCAPDCPCQHKHTAWQGARDGGLTTAANLIRALAERPQR